MEEQKVNSKGFVILAHNHVDMITLRDSLSEDYNVVVIDTVSEAMSMIDVKTTSASSSEFKIQAKKYDSKIYQPKRTFQKWASKHHKKL